MSLAVLGAFGWQGHGRTDSVYANRANRLSVSIRC